MNRLLAPLAFSFALLLTVPLQAEFYTITILPTLGGEVSEAEDINDKGQIVGRSKDLAGVFQAFVYANGQMTFFGLAGAISGHARGINNTGKIVGTSITAAGHLRPIIYDAGTVTDLGTFGGNRGSATDINDLGFIVGGSQYPGNDRFVGFVSIFPITAQDTASFANAINASGETVGFTGTPASLQAFSFKNGQISLLGTLGGTYGEAYGINASGVIVGTSYLAGDAAQHAFVYANGTMRDLGHLGGDYSEATDIADNGTIVGTSSVAGGAYHAFVHAGGRMRDLNRLIPPRSGLVLFKATAINASGQIVGYGPNAAGKTRGFLLTPDRKSPTISLRGARRLTTSGPSVKISGTARDNAHVDRVEFRNGKSKARKASGTTRWRINALLKPGRNKITIRAKDGAERFSRPVTVNVFRR
jgi:probable HAF family extracellular repeat protein